MSGGGEIVIEGRGSDGIVEIQVSDTGPGISDENRELIFEPFFTTRAPSEGSGLGLSLSYEIIRRRGGELRLAPSTRGASFVVRLPQFTDRIFLTDS
jgi:signal transduction histidine kinase